jgi:hypothetical protein
MANIHFLRKLASDELYDTLFFASGEVPIKIKSKDFVTLKTTPFEAKIYSTRKIILNDRRFNTVHEARLIIQQCMR